MKNLPHSLLSLAFALVALPFRAQTSAPVPPDQVVKLSEFTVESAITKEYMATNSARATRVNLPLKEVPFNLQIITAPMIEDTAAFASSYSRGPGAQREAVSWSGSVDDKRVRGFNTREFLRNGFLRYTDNSAFNIDRVEIIKGPIAILDGITSPGGVMNVVTKRPEPAKEFFRTKLLAGSAPYDRFSAVVDFNSDAGPARERGKLLSYRLISSYEYQTNGTRFGPGSRGDFSNAPAPPHRKHHDLVGLRTLADEWTARQRAAWPPNPAEQYPARRGLRHQPGHELGRTG